MRVSGDASWTLIYCVFYSCYRYKGHINGDYRLIPAFTNTDSHVIAGSENGKIFIWDLVEGTVELELNAHDKPVTCVVYHPKIKCMLSASFDGTAKIWI